MSALRRRTVLVLCYHAVSPTWPAPLSVTPANLRAQIAHLLGRGMRPVTFGAAVEDESDDDVLAITFDDAYRSVATRAAPILAELGVPATVFAPTAHIGTERPMAWPGIDRWLGTPHAEELVPMSWHELSALADAGWEIGSHTRTHPRLTQLPPEGMRAELADSRAACEERLRRPCTSIAYPYGNVSACVLEHARQAGYRHGAGLPGRLSEDEPLLWPRVGIYHGDPVWRFRLKVALPTRRLRASRLTGSFVEKALLRRAARPPR